MFLSLVSQLPFAPRRVFSPLVSSGHVHPSHSGFVLSYPHLYTPRVSSPLATMSYSPLATNPILHLLLYLPLTPHCYLDRTSLLLLRYSFHPLVTR